MGGRVSLLLPTTILLLLLFTVLWAQVWRTAAATFPPSSFFLVRNWERGLPPSSFRSLLPSSGAVGRPKRPSSFFSPPPKTEEEILPELEYIGREEEDKNGRGLCRPLYILASLGPRIRKGEQNGWRFYPKGPPPPPCKLEKGRIILFALLRSPSYARPLLPLVQLAAPRDERRI